MDAIAMVEDLRKKVTPKQSSDIPKGFVDLLNSLLEAAKIGAEAMLGGSYAKGTYLEGDHDIDVFVRFDKRYKDEEMPDLLSLAISGLGGVHRIHGSRDYFQLEKDGFSFEVVPVLKVERAEESRNVTDVSPLHVAHVKARLKDRPELAADIRLTKLFCKAAKVYGAESYIGGFSGHVLDNLVLHHGSFLGLIEAAASWPAKVFIDPQGKHADANFLDEAKRQSPLVLLDPIQPDRNAAAALSQRCFSSFKRAAKSFLEGPDVSFFTVVPLTKETLLAAHPGKEVFCYSLLPLKGSRDVVGTKLLKAHQHFLKHAKDEGFFVIDDEFEFSGKGAFCAIVVEEGRLPARREREGPPLSVKRDAARFRETHAEHEVFEREGRLFAVVPRAHVTLSSLFSSLLITKYWLERVAEAKIL